MSQQQTFRVVVTSRQPSSNETLVKTAAQLGIAGINAIMPSRLFFLRGAMDVADVERISAEFLTDPVTEQAVIEEQENSQQITGNGKQSTVEVTLLPGVTDPAAENLVLAAGLLGIELTQAATGERYEVSGDEVDMTALVERVLSNPVVQQAAINRPIEPPFVEDQHEDDTIEYVPLAEATDDELEVISKERRLSMNLQEMQAIRAYYRSEGRDATDVELEMLAQTWSEHCVHKTFKAKIDYVGPDGEREVIDGIFQTFIKAATEKINKPWVRSTFVDDAGIVRFDENFDLAFKAETHNHPSALDPFGGANTGVGGVIRDIMAVSARPIANTDILCFGMPDMAPADVPEGVLHPSRVADGVIHGIEDYGNKMGIPTVNGSIVYHPGYTSNPLVYCGCVGILPHGSHRVGANPGDLIVSLGGRVGRDGLRGATFSSMEMDQETSEIAGTAVQIGHPIMEKQVLEVVLKCRDEQLYTAITDCGAGGFSSSVGEMGEDVGAEVQLKNVLLKYPGLRPWEIWLSEAQERIVIAVAPENWERVQALAAGQDVEATLLGTFTGDKRMTIRYGDKLVAELSMEFLHDGLPRMELSAEWKPPVPTTEAASEFLPTKDALLKLLAHPTIASKEDIIRRYDHEVQTGTAVKPLVGVHNAGPSDATVIVPQDSVISEQLSVNSEETTDDRPQTVVRRPSSVVRGFALANGICPTYGVIDPYAMGWAAVDEAVRNLVAVGTNPDEISILDNFCWGNPRLPDRLGALVRTSQGMHDAAVAYRTPFISGKDSLNNEYVGADGQQHAIPGTLLISSLGIVPDVEKTTTSDLKAAGNKLFLIGETRSEMGGSYYALLHNEEGGIAPQPLTEGLQRYRSIFRCMQDGLIESCHDLSEGGLGVALAEMAIGGGLGAEINLKEVVGNIAHDDVLLFSESIGRFLIEVKPENEQQVKFNLMVEPNAQIGEVRDDGKIVVNGYEGEQVFEAAVSELEMAWRGKSEETTDHRPRTTDGNAHYLSSVVRRPSSPKVLILHANGSNRDRDAALACELAGGAPEIVHLNQLLSGERKMLDYNMLVVPGGFSYGDDLGAGVLFSAELKHRFGDQLRQFVADGRPTIGICNGFQALVKAGVFEEVESGKGKVERKMTLTYNERGHFECRWVYLEPNQASDCVFTKGMTEPIYCPVAHGEGRFMFDPAVESLLVENNLIALTYTSLPHFPTSPLPTSYPANPNGSALNIAGITNAAGNVLGLMPHPENHIFPWQHPRRHRGETGLDGLRLFANGILAA